MNAKRSPLDAEFEYRFNLSAPELMRIAELLEGSNLTMDKELRNRIIKFYGRISTNNTKPYRVRNPKESIESMLGVVSNKPEDNYTPKEISFAGVDVSPTRKHRELDEIREMSSEEKIDGAFKLWESYGNNPMIFTEQYKHNAQLGRFQRGLRTIGDEFALKAFCSENNLDYDLDMFRLVYPQE